MMNHQKNNHRLRTRETCYLNLEPSGRTFCLLPLILPVRLMKISFARSLRMMRVKHKNIQSFG